MIRTSPAADPYRHALNAGDLLTTMAQIWTPATNPNDLVHLFSGKTVPGYLGAADTIGGVCSYYSGGGMYSFSAASLNLCTRAGLVTHELGHSWGANHACGIMEPTSPNCNKSWCGASLRDVCRPSQL